MSGDETRRLLPRTIARRAAQYAGDKQAIDVTVLDLRKVTDFADYFVICTGVVDVHVKAIADHIEDELRQYGWKPRHIEGTETGRWVLLDYFDVVVHVMLPEARGFYNLERLWGDAARVTVKGVTDQE